MLMTIAVLGGALFIVEEVMLGEVDGNDPDQEERYQNAFEAMWCVFWIVSTLGFDGYIGSSHTPGKMIIAISIMVSSPCLP